MTTPLSIFDHSPIQLPQRLDALDTGQDTEIITRFLRHVARVPNSNLDIKVLSAIQFTADMLDYSDAHIAKILIENGLRAPRRAIPAGFLDFIDSAITRESWEIGAASDAMRDLSRYWIDHGESAFTAVNRTFDLTCEDAFV